MSRSAAKSGACTTEPSFAPVPGQEFEHSMAEKLKKNKKLCREFFPKLFKKFCLKLNSNLSKNTRINSTLSGSTGVFVWVTPAAIVTANVGDSRAILLTSTKLGLQAKQITVDQTPDLKGERARITKSGGVVRQSNRKPKNNFRWWKL